MESPLIYDELEDVELKAQFKDMMGDSGTEEEVLAFLERVRLKVSANPILARIVENEISLLDFALMITDENYVLDDEVYVPTIKCLIDANPSALLWLMHYELPINVIPSHPTLHSIMPWIATKHQWVLDHESIIDDPPVIELIKLYNKLRLSDTTTSSGITETIRQFIEAYPHSLNQEDSNGYAPLHLIMMCSKCEVDLVKKMVELCPSSMTAKAINGGLTPLHVATSTLAKVQGLDTDTKDICKFMIQECSESVRATNVYGMCPIHNLLNHCQYQAVREIVVSLLRAYPESYDMTSSGQAPMSFGFIHHVNSLLTEERALQDHIAQLQLLPGAFVESVKCTRDGLIKSTSDVFNNWVVSSIQAIESKIELNSSLLQHACDYFVDYPNESDHYM